MDLKPGDLLKLTKYGRDRRHSDVHNATIEFVAYNAVITDSIRAKYIKDGGRFQGNTETFEIADLVKFNPQQERVKWI